VNQPIVWPVGSVEFAHPPKPVDPLRSLFEPRPLITHKFRAPDSRAPFLISQSVTLVILGLLGAFFVGLLMVPANLSNFPMGASFLSVVLFLGSFGCILLLFVLYFLRLNLLQTLSYLFILTLPTVFFGHRVLSHLAEDSEAADEKKKA